MNAKEPEYQRRVHIRFTGTVEQFGKVIESLRSGAPIESAAPSLEGAEVEISTSVPAERTSPALVGTAAKAELKRRCNWLAATATRNAERQRVCRVCGKSIGAEHALAKHLQRRHPAAVAAMPAEMFPRIGA